MTPRLSTQSQAAATRVDGPDSVRLWLVLPVSAPAQLMVVLDATIANVALRHVQRAFGFSGTGLEWVVNAYALAFGGPLLLGGRMGDCSWRLPEHDGHRHRCRQHPAR
jgi:MFS family permease